jgi:putative ABC transport system permease protein
LIFVRLPSGNTQANLERVKGIYSKVINHRPFDYEFVDQQYSNLYDAELRMGNIFSVFATLAIIIACLGLLGLVSFSASQKTKEIGVRKVLGATATSIVLLIINEFTKPVIVAIVLGIPVAWWIMSKWLSDFAYKTDIGAQPILIAALVSIVVAFGTASFQAIKASMINPADTLRNE